MGYLSDLWIWLSFGMGFGWMAVGGVLAWWIYRYAAPDSRLPLFARIAAVLACLCYIGCGALYSIGYLQRRFGSAVDPYTAAFILGALPGFALLLWFAVQGEKRPS
jgi:hypothetical protein